MVTTTRVIVLLLANPDQIERFPPLIERPERSAKSSSFENKLISWICEGIENTILDDQGRHCTFVVDSSKEHSTTCRGFT